MPREPLHARCLAGAFLSRACTPENVCGISQGFPWLSPMHGQVAHVLRTRSPLNPPRRENPVRLACVKRAASVRPEPGSNSPLENPNSSLEQTLLRLFGIRVDSFPVFYRHSEDTMPPSDPKARACHRDALFKHSPTP